MHPHPKLQSELAEFFLMTSDVVLRFARDAYRGREGVVVYLLNLQDENERKRLEGLL